MGKLRATGHPSLLLSVLWQVAGTWSPQTWMLEKKQTKSKEILGPQQESYSSRHISIFIYFIFTFFLFHQTHPRRLLSHPQEHSCMQNNENVKEYTRLVYRTCANAYPRASVPVVLSWLCSFILVFSKLLPLSQLRLSKPVFHSKTMLLKIWAYCTTAERDPVGAQKESWELRVFSGRSIESGHPASFSWYDVMYVHDSRICHWQRIMYGRYYSMSFHVVVFFFLLLLY